MTAQKFAARAATKTSNTGRKEKLNNKLPLAFACAALRLIIQICADSTQRRLLDLFEMGKSPAKTI